MSTLQKPPFFVRGTPEKWPRTFTPFCCSGDAYWNTGGCSAPPGINANYIPGPDPISARGMNSGGCGIPNEFGPWGLMLGKMDEIKPCGLTPSRLGARNLENLGPFMSPTRRA